CLLSDPPRTAGVVLRGKGPNSGRGRPFECLTTEGFHFRVDATDPISEQPSLPARSQSLPLEGEPESWCSDAVLSMRGLGRPYRFWSRGSSCVGRPPCLLARSRHLAEQRRRRALHLPSCSPPIG